MKFVISGKEYSAEAVANVSMNDLRLMRKETGLTIGQYQELLNVLSTKDSMNDIFEDEGALLAFSVTIWLSRRAAGEKVTLEEACDFPLTDFGVVPDEQAAEESVPDPK